MMIENAENNFTLHTLQNWMQTVLVNPLGTENRQPVDLLPENLQDDIEKIILPSSRLSGRQRLAIYQRGYLARLRDCMAGQFKGLQYALGPELFQAFADEYLQQYPSVSYTLANLGRRFAAFLDQTRPDHDAPENEREEWPDFMIELAQLEYALLQVFDGEEDKNTIPATNTTPDKELKLNSLLRLFSFRFPTGQYLQAVHRGDKPALPYSQASFTAVIRKDYQLGLFHLNPSQYYFLSFLQNNPVPTSLALEQFAAQNKINATELDNVWPAWKEKWVAAGFFLKN